MTREPEPSLDRIATDLQVLAKDAGDLASYSARKATHSVMNGSRNAAESVRHGAKSSQDAIQHEIARLGDFAHEKPWFTLTLCGAIGFLVASLLLFPTVSEKVRNH